MDLIDRYVFRVKYLLPARHRTDIVSELEGDLRAEVQERAQELGRPLTDDDLRTILKRWGNPILVAGRYQPTQYLIGPALFPVYWFVLKLIGALYLVPWLVIWFGSIVLSPTYRATHDGLALLGDIGRWWNAAVGAVGTTTIVFVALERAQSRAGRLDRWEPASLPAVRPDLAIGRFTSVTEVVAGALFVLWWTGLVHVPSGLGTTASVTLSASFLGFYWPVLGQAAAGVILSAVNLCRPWWTLPRALARLTLDVVVTLVAGLMLRAGPWVVAGAPQTPAGDAIARGANIGVGWLLLGIGVVSFAVVCFEDVRRVYRLVKER